MFIRSLVLAAPLCWWAAGILHAQYTINTLVSSNATTTYAGTGVAADAAGNVYATATMPGVGGDFVLKVNSSGVTVADGGGPNYPGCGLAISAVFLGDLGDLAVDPSGNLYIAQAGGGPLLRVSGGISSCLANQQSLGGNGIAADSAGNTYVSFGGGSNVWKFALSGAITQVAGTPAGEYNNSTTGCTGDNVPALSAELGHPLGIALDAAEANLYIADEYCNAVRKVNLSSGIITTTAGTLGNNHPGQSGDGGPATQATLDGPYGVAVDVYGNLYISDTGSAKIRQVNTADTINTIAGNGQVGTEGAANGDGGPATSGEIDSPREISVGLAGKIYIADWGHASIRVLTPVAAPPPPFGSIDTPANNSTGLSGGINVTGWALSTSTVASVGVYREPLTGEAAGSNGLVFLSDAFFLPGARPDVAAAYPGYPQNNWGWGVQVLTNELPGQGGQPLGNGSYKLHAIATDPNGISKDLGTVAISVDNADSVLPFGTIDTPAPGATISGSAYVNFGWVLTPLPNMIPLNGSTIQVFIDNKPMGHPVYNNYRADIATLFPGYKNSGVLGMPADGGAIGYFRIDTTQLSNGLHTISWGARDNAGHGNGLGSRYFLVQN